MAQKDLEHAERQPRLADLFTVRTQEPIEFTVEIGGQTYRRKVHVAKLNGPDTEAVERRARAVRARRLEIQKNPDDDFYQSLLHADAIAEADPVELVAALVADKMAKPAIEIRAEIQHSEKWSKDGRFEALLDAWYGDKDDDQVGLMYIAGDLPAEESDDPEEQVANELRKKEAESVWKALKEFDDEVNERLVEKRDELAEEYLNADGEVDPDDVDGLRHEVVRLMLRTEADLVYGQELERQRLFYAVRQGENWRKREFGTVAEVDDLRAYAPHVIRKLENAYKDLALGNLAGKDSPGTPGSSLLSDLSAAVGPSQQPGPESAIA